MEMHFFFSGHKSRTFLCRRCIIVFGPHPPQCKSTSFAMLYGRDMFLVSDSCSMLNHVKPQLCVLVSVCQEACNIVGACLTSRFHALSASKLANSCIFHQKWFLEMWVFFPIFQRGGWQDQGDGEAGLQLNVRCASYAAVQFVHGFISNKVLNHAREHLLPVETPWRRSPRPVGAKPIGGFS